SAIFSPEILVATAPGETALHHRCMLSCAYQPRGGHMYRYLYYLLQPGVVSTGLMGTALQVGITFANTFNVAGAADTIAQYGLSGQLASGGLIAALTGAYYTLTQRKISKTVAGSAGAVAGGISGTLGTAITQAVGWTALAEGATPLIDF